MAIEGLKKPSLLMLMKSKTGIQSFAGVHAASILLYFNLLDFYARACYFFLRKSMLLLRTEPVCPPPGHCPRKTRHPDAILIPECWPTFRDLFPCTTFHGINCPPAWQDGFRWRCRLPGTNLRVFLRVGDRSSTIGLNLSGTCGPEDTWGLLLSKWQCALPRRRPATTKERFSPRALPCRQSVLMVEYGMGAGTNDDTRTRHPVGGGTMLRLSEPAPDRRRRRRRRQNDNPRR